MKPIQQIAIPVLCLSACTLSACAKGVPVADSDAAAKPNADLSAIHTVKPGPDLQIATELREPVQPGGAGALTVSFTEQYASGEMRVRASVSDGLELVTTISETAFNMAGKDGHDWTVFFSAPEAGRHYVNFHVSVDTPFGSLTKSSAAIIQVGKEDESAASSKTQADVERDAQGDPVIMMDAVETISQSE